MGLPMVMTAMFILKYRPNGIRAAPKLAGKGAPMTKSRAAGTAVLAGGLLLCAAAFLLSEDFTPELGTGWNLKHMEVVLQDRVEESFMDVSAFRERYPEYADMEGGELAARLHAKYFSGMPEARYLSVFLTAPSPGGGGGGGDPLMIRGDLRKLRATEDITRLVMTSDAVEFGLVKYERRRVAFPFRYALSAALGLMALGLTAMAIPGKSG